MKNQLVLVDADSLIYLAGIAGQKTKYYVVMEGESGYLYPGTFRYVKDIDAHCEEHNLTVIDKEKIIEELPVEFSLHVVKAKLEEIQRKYGKRLRVYIKGAVGKNFRDEIYTVQGYKANRNTPKPLHYDAIVSYMLRYWDAIRIEWKEVDDQVALDAYESSMPYIVCSPDKDLDQIPGLHWNYRTAVEYTISEAEAREFFWTQVLMGDAADNIGGCWNVGEGKAKKLIAEWIDEHDEVIWENILKVYEESMEHETCPYKEMDADEVAIQTARCVWMQTERNALWTPPGDEFQYMAIEEERWDG